MWKNIIAVTIIACAFASPAVAEGMGFNAFLNACLSGTTDIADAREAFKEASLAYDGAVARNASSIESEGLLAARDRKAMDVVDVSNQAVIDAFSLYSQHHEYSKALAISAHRIAASEESLGNDAAQFALGLISESEFLSRKLKHQAAIAGHASIGRNLDAVQRKIVRATGSRVEFAAELALDTAALLGSLAAVPFENAMMTSAHVFSAKANLSIQEKIWSVISTSSYANEIEKKDTAEKYRDAKKAYRKAVESLEDSCIQLELGIQDLARQAENNALALRISEISTDSAALRKTYGKATELEISNARNDHQEKLDEARQFNYRVIAKKLELIKMEQGDCAAYIRDVMKGK